MAVRDLLHDFENFLGKLTPKALFAGDAFQGQPATIVTEDEIVLMGSKTSLVRVEPDGIQLSGNIALSATPEQIAIASYWRLNPLLLTCLPSTTPTPIPTLVKSTPPLFEGRKSFEDGLQYLMGFSDAPETEPTDTQADTFWGATGEQPEDEESFGGSGESGSGSGGTGGIRTTSSLDRDYLLRAIAASYLGMTGTVISQGDLDYWYKKASTPEKYSDRIVRVGWNAYWEARMAPGNTGSADPKLGDQPARFQP